MSVLWLLYSTSSGEKVISGEGGSLVQDSAWVTGDSVAQHSLGVIPRLTVAVVSLPSTSKQESSIGAVCDSTAAGSQMSVKCDGGTKLFACGLRFEGRDETRDGEKIGALGFNVDDAIEVCGAKTAASGLRFDRLEIGVEYVYSDIIGIWRSVWRGGKGGAEGFRIERWRGVGTR